MSEQPRSVPSEHPTTPEYGFQSGTETFYPQTPNHLYGPAAGPTDHEVYVGALADALQAAEPVQSEVDAEVNRATQLEQAPRRILSDGIRVNSQLRQQVLGSADKWDLAA